MSRDRPQSCERMKSIFLFSVVFQLMILLSGEREKNKIVVVNSLLLEVEGRGLRGGIIIISEDGYRDIQIVNRSFRDPWKTHVGPEKAIPD